MKSIYLNNINEQIELLNQIKTLDSHIETAAHLTFLCLINGGKILFCGNGGSAADSQHLAAELIGRFIKDRRPIAALALTTDTSVITCVGNDYSFDEIFARQVNGIGEAKDILIAISTSGNSRNVIRAVEEAKKIGMHVIGLLGRDGGELVKICDLSLLVPSNTTARIQESHILIGHTLCGIIEFKLGLN
jgi:D-sedoheptulose 7-phosphate isomerase